MQLSDRPVGKVVQWTWWPSITAHKWKRVNQILRPGGRSPAPHNAGRGKRQSGVISAPVSLVLDTANWQLRPGKRKSATELLCCTSQSVSCWDHWRISTYKCLPRVLQIPLCCSDPFSLMLCIGECCSTEVFSQFSKSVFPQTCKTSVQKPGTKA